MVLTQSIIAVVFMVLGLGNAYFSWACHKATQAAERAQAEAEARSRRHVAELTAAKLELHNLRAWQNRWIEDGRGPPQ